MKIGEVAERLGVTTQTLRNWEKAGDLTPLYKSKHGTRYYGVKEIESFLRRHKP